MPRIIVVTDARKDQVRPAVLLDEQVSSVHLSTDHASAQLVERVAWAVTDAEHLEGARDGVSHVRNPIRQTTQQARPPIAA